MRLRAVIFLLVLLVAAPTTGAVVSIIATEPAAAIDIPAWHWNIFGTCLTSPRVGNCGSTRTPSGTSPEDVLAFSVIGSSARPWTITLNEVCVRQKEQLRVRLDDYGYSQRFAKSNGLQGSPGTQTPDGQPFTAVNCGNRGPSYQEAAFGNQVLVLGAVGGFSFPNDIYYPAAVQNGTGEVRNYSCIVAGTFAGNRMSCVTHLDNSNNTGQDNGALFASNYYVSQGQKLIMGADRNRTDYRSWPQSFNEIDHYRPPGQRLDTHPAPAYATVNKWDWIFAGPNYWVLNATSRYCPNTPSGGNGWTSDHCMLYGKYAV